MSSKQKKASFFLIWLLILVLGPISVLKNTPFSKLTFQDFPLLINFLQRMAALLIFSLLFVQIILGAWMQKWIEKFGGWIFRFHATQGAIAYSLILAHPLLFFLYNFKIKGVPDPFYVFTDFCLLCPKPIELYYTFGRVAFWFLSLAVIAAILRAEVWWRKNWRKFHILNYSTFFLIAVHAWFTGTDIKTPPFLWLFWVAISIVTLSIFYKFIQPKLKN